MDPTENIDSEPVIEIITINETPKKRKLSDALENESPIIEKNMKIDSELLLNTEISSSACDKKLMHDNKLCNSEDKSNSNENRRRTPKQNSLFMSLSTFKNGPLNYNSGLMNIGLLSSNLGRDNVMCQSGNEAKTSRMIGTSYIPSYYNTMLTDKFKTENSPVTTRDCKWSLDTISSPTTNSNNVSRYFWSNPISSHRNVLNNALTYSTNIRRSQSLSSLSDFPWIPPSPATCGLHNAISMDFLNEEPTSPARNFLNSNIVHSSIDLPDVNNISSRSANSYPEAPRIGVVPLENVCNSSYNKSPEKLPSDFPRVHSMPRSFLSDSPFVPPRPATCSIYDEASLDFLYEEPTSPDRNFLNSRYDLSDGNNINPDGANLYPESPRIGVVPLERLCNTSYIKSPEKVPSDFARVQSNEYEATLFIRNDKKLEINFPGNNIVLTDSQKLEFNQLAKTVELTDDDKLHFDQLGNTLVWTDDKKLRFARQLDEISDQEVDD